MFLSTVVELQGTDASAHRGVGAVTRIQQQDTARHARGVSCADLLKRDLRFSLEGDCLGNTRLRATSCVFGPFLRQIKPIRDRQAGMMIGDRQCHYHLTIGLLAKLATILMVHASGMGAVLRKDVSSIIQTSIGPCRSIAGKTISHTLAGTGSSRPRRIGNKMQQFLMLD